MQIIVPMSGQGSRFRQAGYRDLKPLIEVDGAPMIEHVIRMFPGERDFLFICTKEALAQTCLRRVLQDLVPTAQIAEIETHKLGPVHAVLEAAKYIRPDSPAVVNYCDFSVQWDYSDFKQRMQELDCHGCITAYRGFHPHSLGPNLYAYLRHKNNYLLEIAEKRCFTKNRMQEYASAGTYYFRSGDLLLRYFQKAVQRGLQVNGEFYASLPFNLLVEDGLRVFIYELQRFLQWGTPEDLEEYLAWSRYFRKFKNWKPSGRSPETTNLIPMAGDGIRFARAGFRNPKPVIEVGGKTLVEHSLQLLPPPRRWLAVCQSAHLRDGTLAKTLASGSRPFEIVSTGGSTEGQLASCLLAREQLDPESPLLIAPCDSAAVYDEQSLCKLQADPTIDCLVWTFRNHAHANRHPEQYGWALARSSGEIEDILCKQTPPAPTSKAAGVIGIFWFRKAKYFLEAADRLIAENRRVNGEFYVDSCISVLIQQGRHARIFPVRHYLCLGTPDDVRTFEYWADYFQSQPQSVGVGA